MRKYRRRVLEMRISNLKEIIAHSVDNFSSNFVIQMSDELNDLENELNNLKD